MGQDMHGVGKQRRWRTIGFFVMVLWLVFMLVGCSFGRATPTRTPFPTWTPTPQGQQPAAGAANEQGTAPEQQAAAPTATALPPVPTPEPPTPEPPTAVPTDTPAETPTPAPTDTPVETPTPEPTATSSFTFVLEAAEKFPTESLAANVVRIFLYAYSESDLGLSGYTLRVSHNGSALTVDETTTAGVPEQTRQGASPYTRFANMSVVFVEPQAGRWEVQLLDPSRTPVGPAVTFDLTADERTRELYVRYRQE
ncbi:MAG: hypothetical protein KDE19_07340 [Caldilineaceae bacterium]|nr:hypothetical protein [Caldilineaceae bacterium]